MGFNMFGGGVSTKEWERQKHANELKVIDSKAIVYNTILSSATDDLVVLGDRAIRKSFIHSFQKGTSYNNDSILGTRIKYFNFELKGYLDSMTDTFFIPESVLSFDDIVKKLGG